MEKEVMRLARKMVRAEMMLENMKKSHDDRCVTQVDPDSIAPCNCGVDKHNRAIDKVIEELKTDD